MQYDAQISGVDFGFYLGIFRFDVATKFFGFIDCEKYYSLLNSRRPDRKRLCQPIGKNRPATLKYDRNRQKTVFLLDTPLL